MPFCVNCGHRLYEGSRFCSNCGAKVPITEETIDSGYKYPDKPKVIE